MEEVAAHDKAKKSMKKQNSVKIGAALKSMRTQADKNKDMAAEMATKRAEMNAGKAAFDKMFANRATVPSGEMSDTMDKKPTANKSRN